MKFSGDAELKAVNNIVWNNSSIDFRTESASNELITNNIGTLSGTPGVGSENNISLSPKFKSISNFRLQANSPSIGTGSIPNVSVLFSSALTDIDGNPRGYGFKLDMGAYQSDLSELCVVIPVKLSGAVVVCL